MDSKASIIKSIDAFIRKYYKNKLLKGILIAGSLICSLFLVVVLSEYFVYFSVTVRTFIFWAFIFAIASSLIYYVAIPWLKMHKLGNCISYEEASVIIGNHFPEIKDKLLNLLQLTHIQDVQSADLLQSSIEQKTAQIKPVPILEAIDLKQNKKYVKYILPPVLVIVLLLFVSPHILIQPTKRIVNHTTHFDKPAPFQFVLLNDSLEVFKNEDYTISVAIQGDATPSEVYLQVAGNSFKMKKIDNVHFSYQLKNVQKSVDFEFIASSVQSQMYRLSVFPKPVVAGFQVHLSYPTYIGKPDEVLVDQGNFTVPQGTVIKWNFLTHYSDSLFFAIDSSSTNHSIDPSGRKAETYCPMHSFSYQFGVFSSRVSPIDTVAYTVSVIPDNSPSISVLELVDSTYADIHLFKGRIKDDYGFTCLDFICIKTNTSDDSIKDTIIRSIPFTKELSQDFYFKFDLSTLNLVPGDELKYYFKVCDNDAINGNKCTLSQQFEFNIPSEQELDEIIEKNSSEVLSNAEMTLSEIAKLQEEINELIRRMVDKKELNWQDKKDIHEFSEKQKQLKESISKMQRQLNENNLLEQKYRQQNDELMKKQEELNKLMNEVLNEEMKEMMRQIENMMQQLDKNKIQEQLQNIKIDNEQLSKQLDQNIELMKRLELEKQVQSAIEKAEQLAEKQEELSEQTQGAKSREKEELLSKQQELSDQYEQLKKDIDSISSEYKKLDEDSEFAIDSALTNSIDRNQKESKNQLNKGNNKKASDLQKQAADDLERLSEQLAEEQLEAEQSDLVEDSEMIRRVLKNLVQLSFNQESLINDVKSTYIQDPKYQDIIGAQNKLKNDFKNIEDSLRAVAKRQVSVASVINKELANINTYIANTMSSLLSFNQTFYGNSKNISSSSSMQYSMTSLNNLSLFLAESLDQLQDQMRQNQQRKNSGNCKKDGMKMSGNCDKPGKGKPSPKSMKQMQDALNKQIQSLKKQLEKQGNTPGRPRLGEKNTMSEEFAKMAAQQEMIRRMLQEYGQEMKQQSPHNAKMLREIDQMMKQMEQTETDLVNKTITNQTISRQHQISTRLLEHEKAEMEREKDERRQSKEAVDLFQPSQVDIEKFEKIKESSIELFRTSPPPLSDFYKNKVNDYFYNY